MILTGARCRLRPFAAGDAVALAAAANDPEVSRWVTQRFPFPYGVPDAEVWLGRILHDDPIKNWAIEVDGALAGGIGFKPLDFESAGVAEFGYWLGSAFWGRGIATEAATLLADYALRERRLRRLEARVFTANAPSARVLEKAGFVRESILHRAYVDRDGNVCDGWLYVRL
jgi:ribosomal-protein-alanine N-acetyltransferase